MSLAADDPRAPYERVADAVSDDIRTGRLKPGAKLLSVRDLAKNFGVATMTVQRALGELRERGLITTSSRGSFVRPPQDTSVGEASGRDDVHQQIAHLNSQIQQLVSRVAALERAIEQRNLTEHHDG